MKIWKKITSFGVVNQLIITKLSKILLTIKRSITRWYFLPTFSNTGTKDEIFHQFWNHDFFRHKLTSSANVSEWNKFIMSWTSMLNEAEFWNILLPSSASVNYYVVHSYRRYVNLDGNNRTCRRRWEEVGQCNYLK